MKTLLSAVLAVGILSTAAHAQPTQTVFGDLQQTAPRSLFDQVQDTAPRSIFDDIKNSAPRSPFDGIQDSAPRSDGVFGDLERGAP